MFLQGMTYKEIAGHYVLTSTRIEQILDRQARRANYYKKLLNEQDYQALVRGYIEKIKREETIIISSEEDKMIHMMAVNEAGLRIATNDTRNK